MNNGGAIDRGHVRVYRLSGGISWQQEGGAGIGDIDGEANADRFGRTVFIMTVQFLQLVQYGMMEMEVLLIE